MGESLTYPFAEQLIPLLAALLSKIGNDLNASAP
jgi:hypothetical protein